MLHSQRHTLHAEAPRQRASSWTLCRRRFSGKQRCKPSSLKWMRGSCSGYAPQGEHICKAHPVHEALWIVQLMVPKESIVRELEEQGHSVPDLEH